MILLFLFFEILKCTPHKMNHLTLRSWIFLLSVLLLEQQEGVSFTQSLFIYLPAAISALWTFLTAPCLFLSLWYNATENTRPMFSDLRCGLRWGERASPDIYFKSLNSSFLSSCLLQCLPESFLESKLHLPTLPLLTSFVGKFKGFIGVCGAFRELKH